MCPSFDKTWRWKVPACFMLGRRCVSSSWHEKNEPLVSLRPSSKVTPPKKRDSRRFKYLFDLFCCLFFPTQPYGTAMEPKIAVRTKLVDPHKQYATGWELARINSCLLIVWPNLSTNKPVRSFKSQSLSLATPFGDRFHGVLSQELDKISLVFLWHRFKIPKR